MNLSIRKATPNDMAAVHALTIELAVFENAPEQVETSPEIYVQDAFGDRPYFECFVAETPENGIVGAAMFYMGYSSWKGKMLYLDDLIITESFRRKGIGRKLLDRLVAYAVAQNVQQMRWHVLEWNTPAIKMYESVQAELDPEWTTCRLTRAQMEAWRSV